MKLLRLLVFSALLMLGISTSTHSQIWINEFHYDNASTDAGEFIELAVKLSFSDIDNATITLYNGSSSGTFGSYATYPVADFTAGATSEDVTFYYMDVPGIQNGSPDGISLDVNGELVQFLSYEGTFTASNGPAQGITSTDIGVEETGSTAIGSSLSLTGTGPDYGSFTWGVTTSDTKGDVNTGQQIEASAAEFDVPTLRVFVDGEVVESASNLDFGSVALGDTATFIVSLYNVGDSTLTFSSLEGSGVDFSFSDLADSSLDFNEFVDVNVLFTPTTVGDFTADFTIESNAVNDSTFSLNFTGKGYEGDAVLTIAQAREFPQGTSITVSGIVTVAEEFHGPVYFQDATAGIAWYDSDMRESGTDAFLLDIQRGDSIVVTGTLSNFYELLQISDANVEFEVFRNPFTTVTPLDITISELNSGIYEGQLVQVEASITAGVLQANTNFTITDATGTGQLRIDKYSEIDGATPPSGVSTIVGVVGRFNDTFQITPRDLNDISAEAKEYPGEDISKDETIEIVTWNVEWFGSAANGPEDDEIQLSNVITVIDSLDADVIALQEISSETMFDRLIDSLDGYSGLLADFSQTQKTAYVYKTATITRRSFRLIEEGMNYSDWAAGRYPFMFQFNATLNGEVREFFLYNIHAKAYAESSDYSQRLNASTQLKSYLDTYQDQENVIILGDFNDEILESTYNGISSPYKNFDEDEEYTIITKSLEEEGYTSYSSYSMIDHMILSSELVDEYFEGTERLENPNYVGSYLSQTSDHYPVWVRLQWGEGLAIADDIDQPYRYTLSQNYPNPFNPSTVISYQLPVSSLVNLEVFDMTGRKVATLINRQQTAGQHEVTFDAANLSSGVYVYRLQAGNQTITKKMLLVK